MRKLFFIVLIGFLGVGISTAQELDLGLKVGANFAEFSDVKGADLSNKTGFQIGAFAAIRMGNVAIQPELLYSQQGAKFNHEKIELDYVNVPVMLKYYLIQGLNLQVGPQFGFVVNDNIGKVFNEIAESNDFDVSGLVGVGLDLPFGIRLDGRYNFGFSDAIKSNSGGPSAKNSVFTLSIGYSFL
ncbi:MAG TPA: porin family protein [Flavobacteriaceae bacterium]|nr:porin family protein [Flavobacteriaceae bacterium]